jgi:SAM-dependent methyltransferase
MGRAGRAQAIAALLPGLSRIGVAEPEVERTHRGARLVQNGSVLSEVLSKPGATDSVFDALAAAVRLFSPGDRVGILGFAGGGMIAPLRAMGGGHKLSGVDLDRAGYELFCDLSVDWMGDVRFTQADAVEWLRSERGRFDLLLEDLSVGRDGDVFKPDVSIDTLPRLIQSKLKPGGVAVFNLLPPDDRSWAEMTAKVCAPFEFRLQVLFESYYNRLLVLGNEPLPAVREVSRRLRESLVSIDSEMAVDISVRSLRLAKR